MDGWQKFDSNSGIANHLDIKSAASGISPRYDALWVLRRVEMTCPICFDIAQISDW
jgi:hypothetical protein